MASASASASNQDFLEFLNTSRSATLHRGATDVSGPSGSGRFRPPPGGLPSVHSSLQSQASYAYPHPHGSFPANHMMALQRKAKHYASPHWQPSSYMPPSTHTYTNPAPYYYPYGPTYSMAGAPPPQWGHTFKPSFPPASLYNEWEVSAAVEIQRIVRGFLARNRCRRLRDQQETKEIEADMYLEEELQKIIDVRQSLPNDAYEDWEPRPEESAHHKRRSKRVRQSSQRGTSGKPPLPPVPRRLPDWASTSQSVNISMGSLGSSRVSSRKYTYEGNSGGDGRDYGVKLVGVHRAAARVIQRAWRDSVARESAKAEAAKEARRVFHLWLEELETDRQYLMCREEVFRRDLAAMEAELRSASVSTHLTAMATLDAAHRAQSMREALLSIQRIGRGHLGRQSTQHKCNERRKLDAIELLQRVSRGYALRWSVAEFLHFQVQSCAATRIQRIWRGCSCRLELSRRDRALLEECAAIRLQRVWKGVLCRRWFRTRLTAHRWQQQQANTVQAQTRVTDAEEALRCGLEVEEQLQRNALQVTHNHRVILLTASLALLESHRQEREELMLAEGVEAQCLASFVSEYTRSILEAHVSCIQRVWRRHHALCQETDRLVLFPLSDDQGSVEDYPPLYEMGSPSGAPLLPEDDPPWAPPSLPATPPIADAPTTALVAALLGATASLLSPPRGNLKSCAAAVSASLISFVASVVAHDDATAWQQDRGTTIGMLAAVTAAAGIVATQPLPHTVAVISDRPHKIRLSMRHSVSNHSYPTTVTMVVVAVTTATIIGREQLEVVSAIARRQQQEEEQRVAQHTTHVSTCAAIVASMSLLIEGAKPLTADIPDGGGVVDADTTKTPTLQNGEAVDKTTKKKEDSDKTEGAAASRVILLPYHPVAAKPSPSDTPVNNATSTNDGVHRDEEEERNNVPTTNVEPSRESPPDGNHSDDGKQATTKPMNLKTEEEVNSASIETASVAVEKTSSAVADLPSTPKEEVIDEVPIGGDTDVVAVPAGRIRRVTPQMEQRRRGASRGSAVSSVDSVAVEEQEALLIEEKLMRRSLIREEMAHRKDILEVHQLHLPTAYSTGGDAAVYRMVVSCDMAERAERVQRRCVCYEEDAAWEALSLYELQERENPPPLNMPSATKEHTAGATALQRLWRGHHGRAEARALRDVVSRKQEDAAMERLKAVEERLGNRYPTRTVGLRATTADGDDSSGCSSPVGPAVVTVWKSTWGMRSNSRSPPPVLPSMDTKPPIPVPAPVDTLPRPAAVPPPPSTTAARERGANRPIRPHRLAGLNHTPLIPNTPDGGRWTAPNKLAARPAVPRHTPPAPHRVPPMEQRRECKVSPAAVPLTADPALYH